MRAVVLDRYGPPDVLRLDEVERPVPEDNQVLVKVRATTVNRTDCGLRAAKPFISRYFTGLLRPKRRILGSELAGEVEAVGAGVTELEVGDHVFGITGYNKPHGTHAEFIRMPAKAPLAHKPVLALLTRWVGDKRVTFAVGKYTKEDVLFLKELIEAGKYRAVIDRSYPLEDVIEATRYVETGQKTGNVVLTVSDRATHPA
jgi:NADPH:quinone reductase-like Zn-dependent oxidoreductase